MKIPKLNGLIRRRLLLNYRLDPDVATAQLPAPFRPKRIAGFAIAGVCLIRLEEIRPARMPAILGISSENAAFRYAVEWENEVGETCERVFIPRRDTGSRINALSGGRIFPGVHHFSRFRVQDRNGRIAIRIDTKGEDSPIIDVEAVETDSFPRDSAFSSLEAASRFFETGCLGYSARPCGAKLDGLRLEVMNWKVKPVKVIRLTSAYFEELERFPTGSIAFDHALLMRRCEHTWTAEADLEARCPNS